MRSKIKIAAVTSTRADYGLLYPLLKELVIEESFEFQLFVTGTHLSREFGYTKDVIEKDGFKITEEIEALVSSDTPAEVGKTAGLTLAGLAEAFFIHKPNLIILLGDRYEILATAMAANICGISIAHLHGGEITEGANDDSFRHAITKMSLLHFTSTEQHRQRVIRMGEAPDRVYNVGAIGLDNIKSLNLLSRDELENNLEISFKAKNILLTVHPETMAPGTALQKAEIIITALNSLINNNKLFVIITGSNADSEGRLLSLRLKDFAQNNESCLFIENLGQLRYLSVLRIVDCVVGNSSSGIIEVPSFKIPTINIGDRQKGRMRAESVIDISWDKEEIVQLIQKTLNKKKGAGFKYLNPYGDGGATAKIISILKERSCVGFTPNKIFYDGKDF